MQHLIEPSFIKAENGEGQENGENGRPRPGKSPFFLELINSPTPPESGIPLPEHGSCHVCGKANPAGLGIQLYSHTICVRTSFTLDIRQQGAPNLAHGGVLAAILDEAMGCSAWARGHVVMSAKIEVDYRRPVPLGQPILAAAWVDRENGRKVWTASCLYSADGTVYTEGRGLFVEARKNFRDEHLEFDEKNRARIRADAEG